MNANPAFAPSALTLTLSGGASIAVTHGTDLMLLRRVLEALS